MAGYGVAAPVDKPEGWGSDGRLRVQPVLIPLLPPFDAFPAHYTCPGGAEACNKSVAKLKLKEFCAVLPLFQIFEK